MPFMMHGNGALLTQHRHRAIRKIHMNRIITFQDFRKFGFKNLWELQNPRFEQASEESTHALPRFKRRHGGGGFRFLTDFAAPSRLYGLRKIFAWLFWLLSALLIFGTALSFSDGSFNIGQASFTLMAIGLYLICFAASGASRLRRWDKIYTAAIKQDVATHTEPAIIFDGQDMLLGNARIFEMLGERKISAFVEDYSGQLKEKERQHAEAKKRAEAEKVALKKQKEDEEYNEALGTLKAIHADRRPRSGSKPPLASRAAQAARGTVEKDSISARAARAARGRPARPSSKPSSPPPSYIKIEGFTGSYWETCASGLENNSHYIAKRIQQLRKSNPRFTKFRAVDGNGRVVDVG
jgi:hypothetical protein